MKITKNKLIDSGVYTVKVWTSDWSANDLNLMVAFGEPEINCGGDIVAGTPPAVTGTTDMTSGHDWSSSNAQTLTVACAAAFSGTKTVTLSTNCANLSDVVAALMAALDAAGAVPGITAEADVTSTFVKLRADVNGATASMTLGGAALGTLGVPSGSYTGSGLPTFHMADDYHKIKTEVPFAAGFDQRDETVPADARAKADAWLAQIVALLKASIDALRAGSLNFDSESSETY